MKLWVKRTSIKTEKLFGLSINKEKNRIEIADVFDTRQNPVKMRKLK